MAEPVWGDVCSTNVQGGVHEGRAGPRDYVASFRWLWGGWLSVQVQAGCRVGQLARAHLHCGQLGGRVAGTGRVCQVVGSCVHGC